MKKFNCFSIEYYPEHQVLIWKIKDSGMPNFCIKGLEEFKEFAIWIKEYFSDPERPLRYIVSASEHDGIYNMGGDLSFFLTHIRAGNTKELTRYAHLCIDAIYEIYTSFGLPALTIALVEGNAYGGGLECALAHDYSIAEEKAKFCLPENKFNLFPGMGAYSLLFRKLQAKDANAFLRDGKIYNAQYVHDLGLIEKVAKDGKAIMALHSFLKKIGERFNFEYYHIQSKKKVFPLQKEELLKITDLWVEACMKTSIQDLRRMEILVHAQTRKAKVVV